MLEQTIRNKKYVSLILVITSNMCVFFFKKIIRQIYLQRIENRLSYITNLPITYKIQGCTQIQYVG